MSVIRRCCVVGKLNYGVGFMLGHAVFGEQGVLEGTEHAPLRGPHVEGHRGRCVVTLTTWGRPIRKSRIQLQREVFSPRVLRLVMGFEGTVVLN